MSSCASFNLALRVGLLFEKGEHNLPAPCARRRSPGLLPISLRRSLRRLGSDLLLVAFAFDGLFQQTFLAAVFLGISSVELLLDRGEFGFQLLDGRLFGGEVAGDEKRGGNQV